LFFIAPGKGINIRLMTEQSKKRSTFLQSRINTRLLSNNPTAGQALFWTLFMRQKSAHPPHPSPESKHRCFVQTPAIARARHFAKKKSKLLQMPWVR
jgi:hypothetical protein